MSAIDTGKIRAELENILVSPVFASSPRMSRFLKFVVEQALEGRQIKEYIVAVEVFDKPDLYDPKTDSTVRTEAGKLRTRLQKYYQAEGQADPVLISIPKGTYVPVFEERQRGIQTIDAAKSQPVPAAVVDPVERSEVNPATGRRPRVWLAGGIGLLLAVGLALTFTGVKPLPATLDEATPVPLTSFPGQELQPAFSPDGNHIAFMWNGEKQDNFDLYVKQIGADSLLRLTTDAGREFGPAWSPDGRFIAFGRLLTPVRCGVFVVPSLGGAERKVAEVRAPSEGWAQPFVAWSPDSQWLAVTDMDDIASPFAPTGFSPASLYLVSVETGEKRRLTNGVSPPVVDSGPAFAPDGRSLAFVRFRALSIGDLQILALTRQLNPAGEPRRLTFEDRRINSPTWTRNGREIVFASGSFDILHLERVAVSGGRPPQHVEFAGDYADSPAMSRQGPLAFSQTSSDVDIWHADLAGPGRLGSQRERFISSTRRDDNPQFSGNGNKIVFISDRSGGQEVWICDRNGSNPMQLTFHGGPITGCPRLSPDGARVVFDSNRLGQFEIYTVSATGGLPERLTNHPGADCCASWSRNGRWIYFMSNRTGQRQIWKIPSGGGEPVQLTKQGGVVAFESWDGRFVYYSERAGEGERNGLGGLRKVPSDGGEETLVLPSVTFLNFAVARDGIYYIPRADSQGRYSLRFLSFATNLSQPVLPLSGIGVGLAASPDGRSLLYTQRDEPKSDLMLVPHFH
jgi:Tol biopolymer transport system component